MAGLLAVSPRHLPPNLPIPTWLDDLDGGEDFWRMGTNLRPSCRRQDQDGNSTVFEVLLITQILIGGDQKFEGGIFSGEKQIAIVQGRPSLLKGSLHRMPDEQAPQRQRRSLVKENSHRSRGAAGQAPTRLSPA